MGAATVAAAKLRKLRRVKRRIIIVDAPYATRNPPRCLDGQT
jgi:hypothetical protein